MTDYGLTREGQYCYGGNDELPTRWMPPEALESDEYTPASEVYSYAILVWELITCEVPWAVNPKTGRPYSQGPLIRAVCSGERPPLPTATAASSSALLGALTQRCWQANATARPSFGQITRQLRLALRQLLEPGSDWMAEVDGGGAAGTDGDSDGKSDGDDAVATADAADNGRKLIHTLRVAPRPCEIVP